MQVLVKTLPLNTRKSVLKRLQQCKKKNYLQIQPEDRTETVQEAISEKTIPKWLHSEILDKTLTECIEEKSEHSHESKKTQLTIIALIRPRSLPPSSCNKLLQSFKIDLTLVGGHW